MAARRKPTSRLHADLAARILRHLKAQEAIPGHRLVELDLAGLLEVSRTPIRGALKLLAAQGLVAARDKRGYVLARPLPDLPAARESPDSEAAQDERLFAALARTRDTLPPHFTQQELARRLGVRTAPVLRLLHRLAALGLVARRAGHGWTLAADTARILNESYAFRRALEPQMLLQPGFRLDRGWAEKSRERHQRLRAKPWRPGDGEAFHQLNADFHEQLARCSANRYMLMAVERQNALRQFLIGRWDYPVAQVHSAIDEHLEILAALEAGYADKAAALMLHHLTQSASQSQKD
jgi:DNA-binding GntR family transcriptional regulator